MANDNTVRCCPDSSVDAAADFTNFGSAETFLRRVGIKEQIVPPLPRIQPGEHRAHSIPLEPPLPLPPLQWPLDGEPPPDRGQTREWPHPNLEDLV